MNEDKGVGSSQASEAQSGSVKKHYTRPVVRRLGTVRELTHGAKSGHTGK